MSTLKEEIDATCTGVTVEEAFEIARIVCEKLMEHYMEHEPTAVVSIKELREAANTIGLHLTDAEYPE